MPNRFLVIFRRIFAGLILFLFLLIFLDYFHVIAPAWAKYLAMTQFIPSLLQFMGKPSFVASAFIVILLITFLFGRVYCSFLCPLGLYMDVLNRFSRRFSINRKFKYLKPLPLLRYFFLLVMIAGIVLQYGSLISILDPYSIFGKICYYVLFPFVAVTNNLLAFLSFKISNFSFYTLELQAPSLTYLGIVFFLFGTVSWMSLSSGRLYCNTVCPVGTFLGIISRFSVYKIQLDTELCNHCHRCRKDCKASCIDSRSQKIDDSRCVMCFNCLQSCSQQALSYSRKKPAPHGEFNKSRRKFFSFVLALPAASISQAAAQPIMPDQNEEMPEEETPIRNYPVSPPGSTSIEEFNKKCTACSLCIRACPTSVLAPALMEYGLIGVGQPRLDFKRNFCNYDCTACTEVCPTGAIRPLSVDEKHKVQMGKVHLIWRRCIVFTDRKDCGACSEHCPTKAVDMVDWKHGLKRPVIDEEICVGCGACEHMCPTTPYKAIYVDGNPVHLVAKPPKTKSDESDIFSPDEDFPF